MPTFTRPVSCRREPTRHLLLLFLLLLTTVWQLFGCTTPVEERGSMSGPPQRIISLVPAVTETLFALGAGDRIVGVSDFDNYPPEALERPRAGALTNPNLERIFELQPDLVFTYGTQALLRERLTVAGIPQYPVVSGSVDQALTSIRAIGREIGSEDAGEKLASQIENALESIRANAPVSRPRVLLVHSRDIGTMGSFFTAGNRSYLNELIEIAGGLNVFLDVNANAFQPSLEEVLERRPEVIIELLPSDQGRHAQIAQRYADWQRLEQVPAVRSGRVYIAADDYLLLLGPRLHLVAAQLAEFIHPVAATETEPRQSTEW
jgi:iron complex transport system substrate-binding protein